jgi:hypothetical protein
MAGIGQLSLRLTWEKNGENGTALSRARHHQIRLNYEVSERFCEAKCLKREKTYSQECSYEADEDGAENDKE